MTAHFNQLTPAQAEALAVLVEECAEAQVAAAKILRHGASSHNPDDPDHEGNLEDLIRECGDVVAAIQIACSEMSIAVGNVMSRKEVKLLKVREYLHHVRLP